MYFLFFLFGAAVVALIVWLLKQNIKLRWYEWLMGALAIILAVAAIQHYSGSMQENIPQAANLGVMMFGIPAVVLAVVTGLTAWRHNQARQ
jgi:uncharacterized membrane protein